MADTTPSHLSAANNTAEPTANEPQNASTLGICKILKNFLYNRPINPTHVAKSWKQIFIIITLPITLALLSIALLLPAAIFLGEAAFFLIGGVFLISLLLFFSALLGGFFICCASWVNCWYLEIPFSKSDALLWLCLICLQGFAIQMIHLYLQLIVCVLCSIYTGLYLHRSYKMIARNLEDENRRQMHLIGCIFLVLALTSGNAYTFKESETPTK